MTWGEIPKEHLTMKTYPADTNANALILCEYAVATADDDYEITFSYHGRVKILNKEGCSWGTIVLNSYDKNEVYDIEGTTYVPDANGNVKKYELESSSIFKEKVDSDTKRFRFTLPQLSPGCVIEWRYSRKIENPIYLPSWTFQNSEPTLWSEYRVYIPYLLVYNSVLRSFFPLAINEHRPIEETRITIRGGESVKFGYGRYAMRNIPAMREEPYMTTLRDYTSQLFFQLEKIYFKDGGSEQILKTWEDVVQKLMDNSYFGKRLDGTRTIRNKTEELTKNIIDPEKRIQVIYNYVRNSFLWNHESTLWVDRDLDDVFEAKSGTSGEINAMLIAMLSKAGLTVQPVLLSTRSNGRIQTLFPILRQFNYSLTRVVLNGKNIFLDATDRFRPMNLLPERVLNNDAMAIAGQKPEWITLASKVSGKKTTTMRITINPDSGLVQGSFQRCYQGYYALSEREDLADQKEEKYLKSELNSDVLAMNVLSSSIQNRDSIDEPFIVKATFTCPSALQSAQDFLMINPMLFDQMRTNPFKSLERHFPIDYAFPRTTEYSIEITIPVGYEIKDTLRTISFYLPKVAGHYSRSFSRHDSIITITTKFEITNPVIEDTYYPALRSCYDNIVAAEKEILLLQKRKTILPIQPPPGPEKKGKKK